MSDTLYTWQSKAIQAWEDADQRGTVMAPTGSGKTRVATTIISDWRRNALEKQEGYGIVVVVPTVRLMKQWYDVMTNELMMDRVGRYGGGHLDRHLSVLVAVVNSARKLYFSSPNTLLICDEAHRMATERNRVIFSNMTHDAVLGLSATPDRADGKDVTHLTGDVVYRLGYTQAVEDGVIPEFTVNIVQTKLNGFERGKYKKMTRTIGMFASKIAEVWGNRSPMTIPEDQDENVTFWRNACMERKRMVNDSKEREDVLDHLLLRNRGKKIAVFHESVDSIERMAHKYRQDDVEVDVFHSETKDGDTQFNRWCNSVPDEGRVLFSCKALKEGINVPSMEVVIMLSGSNDARSRIQTLGRALRGTAADVYLLYAVGTTDKRGWQEMVQVGQIPHRFLQHTMWDGSRIVPLGVTHDVGVKPQGDSLMDLLESLSKLRESNINHAQK